MQGEASAVVEEEESGAWLYVSKVGGEIWREGFLVDRADAEFIFDAVARAHEFCPRTMGELKSLFSYWGSRLCVNLLGESIRHVLFVRDILYGGIIIRHISADLSVKDVFFRDIFNIWYKILYLCKADETL